MAVVLVGGTGLVGSHLLKHRAAEDIAARTPTRNARSFAGLTEAPSGATKK